MAVKNIYFHVFIWVGFWWTFYPWALVKTIFLENFHEKYFFTFGRFCANYVYFWQKSFLRFGFGLIFMALVVKLLGNFQYLTVEFLGKLKFFEGFFFCRKIIERMCQQNHFFLTKFLILIFFQIFNLIRNFLRSQYNFLCHFSSLFMPKNSIK